MWEFINNKTTERKREVLIGLPGINVKEREQTEDSNSCSATFGSASNPDVLSDRVLLVWGIFTCFKPFFSFETILKKV